MVHESWAHTWIHSFIPLCLASIHLSSHFRRFFVVAAMFHYSQFARFGITSWYKCDNHINDTRMCANCQRFFCFRRWRERIVCAQNETQLMRCMCLPWHLEQNNIWSYKNNVNKSLAKVKRQRERTCHLSEWCIENNGKQSKKVSINSSEWWYLSHTQRICVVLSSATVVVAVFLCISLI